MYNIVIKNSDGETLAYVPNAFQARTEYRINELGTMSFSVPSDFPFRDYLVYPNEIWLYLDAVLVDVYKIVQVVKSR